MRRNLNEVIRLGDEQKKQLASEIRAFYQLIITCYIRMSNRKYPILLRYEVIKNIGN